MTSPGTTLTEPPPHGQWLRSQRQARGWNIPEMRRRLRAAATAAGDALPHNEALGLMIRRWEKGSSGIPDPYRLRYCQALGIPSDHFGTAPPPPAASKPQITTHAPESPAPGHPDAERHAMSPALRPAEPAVSSCLEQAARDLSTAGIHLRARTLPDGARHLHLTSTSTSTATCALTITRTGRVTLEYQLPDGTRPSPDHLADIVLSLIEPRE